MEKWIEFVPSIILSILGITMIVVVIYKYIKDKPQKTTLVAVFVVLAIICVVNYRWTSMGLELGNTIKLHVHSTLREKAFSEVKKDDLIIDSTATVTLDSAVTVLKIEESEDIVKSTSVPDETLKNLDDFVYYLAQTKALSQYTFDDWYYKGAGEYSHRKYNEAINSFTKAIELNPENPYPYNYRGVAFLYLSRLNEALADFKKSTDYRWDNLLPHLNMADTYLRQGHIDKAEEEIKIMNGLLEEGKLNESEKAYAEETIMLLKERVEEAKKK